MNVLIRIYTLGKGVKVLYQPFLHSTADDQLKDESHTLP